MTALPALPAEVIAALGAAHFEPDPFSHDWFARIGATRENGYAAIVLNPWDRQSDVRDLLYGRLTEYRYGDDGTRHLVAETPFIWHGPAIAAAIHEWQQTLPESESEL